MKYLIAAAGVIALVSMGAVAKGHLLTDGAHAKHAVGARSGNKHLAARGNAEVQQKPIAATAEATDVAARTSEPSDTEEPALAFDQEKTLAATGNHSPHASASCEGKSHLIAEYERLAASDGQVSNSERHVLLELQRDIDLSCGRFRSRG